jgi:hypothetical protein
MKKLIIVSIAIISLFADIKITQKTQNILEYQWFSSTIAGTCAESTADACGSRDENDEYQNDNCRACTATGGGGGSTGSGGGSRSGSGGSRTTPSDSEGESEPDEEEGTVDEVEQCQIDEIARHMKATLILNVAKEAGAQGCNANGLGVAAIATLFGQPVPGAIAGVIVGAVCHASVSYYHGRAIADANILHETNKAKCD